MFQDAGSGGSGEHALHGDVDAATGRSTVEGVWPIEKHCKVYDFGDWVKG